LVEILVVIGIIVVLAGILLPTVIKAYSQANKNKLALDLQAIGMALEAYKGDFGDYPRTTTGSTNTGAAVLCQALFAPGPVANDGADGLGFRIRAGAGKVYGPYLQTDRWILDDDATVGNAISNYANMVIFTKDYTPILYYPANPAKPDITVAQRYVWTSSTAMYNANDNLTAPPTFTMPLLSLSCLLGDYNNNGAIDSAVIPEASIGNYPYLLISTGPDGAFGSSSFASGSSVANRQAAQACDDVTNFPR